MKKPYILLLTCSILVFSACAKKKVVASTPAAPAPAATPRETPRTPPSTPAPVARDTPPNVPPSTTKPAPTFAERFGQVNDAYFEYDKSIVNESAGEALAKDAPVLTAIFQDFAGQRITIEGHCDNRGSAEYNMALGDRRAHAAKEYLTHLGVPASRLSVVSYGKERPACTEDNESCWAKNRRAHLAAQ